MLRRSPCYLFALSVSLLVLAPALWACSVPVFRYALERWEPDPYEIVIFHKGPLNAAHAALVDELGKAPTARSVNLSVQTVDVSEPLAPELRKAWEAEKPPELPWLLARFPGSPDKAYAGALRREALDGLLDSPLRREAQKRILAGDSAVFVLLESGQADKDNSAAERLTRQLRKLEGELKLPEAADEIARAILENKNAPELKIAFSVMRLSRQDAAERVFADILLNTESDLRMYHEPMVFPIFGRGRVFDALVGKGITDENIRDVCAFIIGPCSCEVKRINPGRDLIMAVDWQATIGAPPPRTTGARQASAPPKPLTETNPVRDVKNNDPQAIAAPVSSTDEPLIDSVAGDGEHAIRNGLLVLAALVGFSVLVLCRR